MSPIAPSLTIRILPFRLSSFPDLSGGMVFGIADNGDAFRRRQSPRHAPAHFQQYSQCLWRECPDVQTDELADIGRIEEMTASTSAERRQNFRAFVFRHARTAFTLERRLLDQN